MAEKSEVPLFKFKTLSSWRRIRPAASPSDRSTAKRSGVRRRPIITYAMDHLLTVGVNRLSSTPIIVRSLFEEIS